MATNTYVALDKVTVGTAVASVTFSSISSSYTDLVVVVSGQVASTGIVLKIQFNSDTASNYSMTELYGTGSSAASSRRTSQTSIETSYNLVNFDNGNIGNALINVMNYSNTTTYKTVLARTNSPSATYPGTVANVGLWRSTAAINSMTLFAGANFLTGSTFSLYGIKAQVTPGTAKATGGTITYDNFGRVIHTFTASGTFTPTAAITEVDYLVVAGGGGGGTTISSTPSAGGGGAGGYRTTVGTSGANSVAESQISVSNGTAYAITIGGGGPVNTNGVDSSAIGGVISITSAGGGKGGTANSGSGGNGGSGGGRGGGGSSVSAGTGTANQGFNGNNGWGNSGGGGGGASSGAEAGGNQASLNGGAGLTSLIDSVARSGGGGGGGNTSEGFGVATSGGGNGSNSGNGVAGTANTGGGGGGAGQSNTSGIGGSGIVIIRYQG